MRIGTITFHWATNYGALLQAYALQKYLKKNNYDAEIINYIPLRVKLIKIIMNIRNLKISYFIKEKKLRSFRRECMELSNITYYNNNSLIKKCSNYDIYICGSDQIWNESFTLGAEGSATLSYYLNFVKDNKKRVSYAASFGTDKLSQKVLNLVKPELGKFNNISVRENSGKIIVEDMGFDAKVVVDPTLLLPRESYEELIKNRKIKKKYELFSYILHGNQTIANTINDFIFEKYFNKNKDKKYNEEPISMFEWLYNVKNSKFVLTNSFHGVVFSIIFHKSFMVIPVNGSKMNDRITTLLNSLGLANRSIDSLDKDKIDKLMKESIDWVEIDSRVECLKKNSMEFISKSLEI